MFRQVKNCISILAILVVMECGAFSQTTSSPYSIFGLGNISGNNIGSGSAMGGTGIAFLSKHSLNLQNPASTGDLDSLLNLFEIGISGKYTSYKTSGVQQALFDANFMYIAMGFRLTPRWSFSTGVTPYSTIGYNINVLSAITGTTQDYNKEITGEGGVSKFFIGNSLKITNNLFFGINAVYLFGNVSQTELSTDYSYKLLTRTYLSNFNLNYGLNYHTKINNWNYSLGLIYDNGKNLLTDKVSTITTPESYAVVSSQSNEYSLPRSIGIGLAFEKDFLRGGIDYEYRQWKNIEFNNSLLESRNTNRYSFGLEVPSLGARRGTGGMIFYRLGAEYSESYMIIKGIPINYRSVSIGAGLPVKGHLSVINLSLELGQNGPNYGGLIKETFCTLHVGLSLKDLWFVKKKYF